MPTEVIDLTGPEVIDLTTPDPPRTIVVDADDECFLCRDEIEDGTTYYCPPCNHMCCYLCMDQHEQLSRCLRCNQPFEMATPVIALVRNITIEI